MRAARVLTFLAATITAAALLLGAAGAASSDPSAAQVAKAKAELKKYEAAHAPKSESKPTKLDQCPWGDELVADVATRQDGYDATATGTATVSSSVYVDQTVDKGTRSVPCTAHYTDTDGASQSLNVVAYADPGLKTAAFAKALAKATKGKARTLDPPTPTLAGGKAEGYCIEYSSGPLCSYVWSRNGLYVEIDSSAENAGNFTELRNVVLGVVDTLPDVNVGVG